MHEVRYISAEWVPVDPVAADRLMEAFGGRTAVRQEGTGQDPPPAAVLRPGDPVILPSGMTVSVRPLAPWHSAGVTLSPVLRLKRDFGGPGTDMFPITPDDEEDLPMPADALWIGSGGSVVVRTLKGATRSIPVGDFTLLPVAVVQVLATGTTASDIHGIV